MSTTFLLGLILLFAVFSKGTLDARQAGSTATVVLRGGGDDPWLLIAHVGDSRSALFRSDKIAKILLLVGILVTKIAPIYQTVNVSFKKSQFCQLRGALRMAFIQSTMLRFIQWSLKIRQKVW